MCCFEYCELLAETVFFDDKWNFLDGLKTRSDCCVIKLVWGDRERTWDKRFCDSLDHQCTIVVNAAQSSI